MTDFWCSCMPTTGPGLHVQRKSLHEAGVLPVSLVCLLDNKTTPSQGGTLGMVLVHLALCMD